MSLINKVLQDLETRRGASAPTAERPVYDDLRPVRLTPPPAPRRGLWAGVMLGALVLVGAGFYLHGRWGQEPTPSIASREAAAPAPAAPPVVSVEAPVPDATIGTNTIAAGTAAPTDRAAAGEPEFVGAPVPGAIDRGGDRRSHNSPLPATAAGTKRASPPPAPSRAATAAAGEPEQGTVEKVVRPLSAGERAESHYRQAVRHLQQGRADRAEEELRSALALHGAHAAARELLAGTLMQRGRWREAQALLEDGLAIAPHPVLARLLARLHLEHGAEGSALAVMEQARPAAARDGEFLAFLAMLCQRAGRHDTAIAAYTEAVGLRPADGRAWLGLAISLEAQQRPGDAAQAHERALASGGLDAGLRQYAQQRLTALKK